MSVPRPRLRASLLLVPLMALMVLSGAVLGALAYSEPATVEVRAAGGKP